MGFLVFLGVVAYLIHKWMKASARRKEEERQERLMEHQRLMARQVHTGELMEPGTAYVGSPRADWKVQAVKAGASAMMGALVGHYQNRRPGNRNHRA
jgi:hypothetical protein